MVQSFDQLLKSHGSDATGDDLVKALATTNSNSGTGAGQQSPLMLENLDGVMTEVLVTEQHFKLYNLLPKVPSANPYFEYNVHKGFGNRRSGLGFAEGGAPKGGTSSFQRNGIYNKFLGVQGGVTHQMMVSAQNGGIFEDPNVRENRDRTIELLERLERELVFGDKSVHDDNGNEVNFDGLLTSLTSQLAGNVVDLQGKPFGYDNLDNSAELLVTAGKQASVNGYTCLMSAHVSKGLNKQYGDRNVVRADKGERVGIDLTPGFKVPSYDGQFGTFNFDHSILLNEVEGSIPPTAAPAGAPSATATPTTAAASGGVLTGTYFYKVCACNDTGESLASTNSTTLSPSGQKVTVTITKPAGNTTTHYRIYRSTTSGGVYKWVGKVADSGSATTTWDDTGAWVPVDANGNVGDGMVIMIKPDPKDICIAQMAPLVKMSLPQVGTTFPFMLLLYIVSVIKAPERVRIYKNCGTYATGNTTFASSL
jgi:hypothetical protein